MGGLSHPAQSYTDEELIFDYGPSAGLEANCTAGPYEEFERSSYTGKKQTWYCPSGRTFYVMAAAPEGRECVVMLQLAVPTQGTSEAERKAIQHILDTFEVNCGGIAGAKTGHRDTAGFARVDGHISPGQPQL